MCQGDAEGEAVSTQATGLLTVGSILVFSGVSSTSPRVR